MTWQPGDGPLRLAPPAAEGSSASDREETADAVIVGAGPGGAAVARVLAAAGARVLVVEEGPPTSRFRPNQGQTMRHHMQEGGALVATGSAPIPIAAGRGVGGGSLINSAIAWRCPDDVLDGWTPLIGDERYGAVAMRPVYDELWELLGITPTREDIAGENNHLVVRGVRKLGLDGGYLDRYTPGCTGCGICYWGCPSGGKASVNTNLLAEAVGSGARILADVKVDRVLVEGGRAVGISGRWTDPDTRAAGGRLTVRAARVILAAGGIGTPRLLHSAGLAGQLGPVGEGLHIHPGNAVFGRCDAPVNWWQGATQGAYFRCPDAHGVLPHTSNLPPEAILASRGTLGDESRAALAEAPYLCGMVVMVSDTGTGSVSAWGDGRARVAYDFAQADIERIKLGMYWSAKVLVAGGARELRAPVRGVRSCDTPELLRDQLADKGIRDFTLYASHPMSTCRMHREPGRGVIGADGQAHGLPGLFVADSSIFPTSLGVNPSVTTMAMATAMARGWAG
jgi:choline dehydrogenase-like flavoprotein